MELKAIHILLAVNHLVDKTPITGEEKLIMDVDKNGTVSLTDIFELANSILSKTKAEGGPPSMAQKKIIRKSFLKIARKIKLSETMKFKINNMIKHCSSKIVTKSTKGLRSARLIQERGGKTTKRFRDISFQKQQGKKNREN